MFHQTSVINAPYFRLSMLPSSLDFLVRYDKVTMALMPHFQDYMDSQ
jgi:hypothetical protein